MFRFLRLAFVFATVTGLFIGSANAEDAGRGGFSLAFGAQHRAAATHTLIQAQNCAPNGSPCSDPNNRNPRWPVCTRDCCSRQYHDCDGLACICGTR